MFLTDCSQGTRSRFYDAPNSTNASPLQELVKDPYVLEFTGILQDERFLEKKRGSA